MKLAALAAVVVILSAGCQRATIPPAVAQEVASAPIAEATPTCPEPQVVGYQLMPPGVKLQVPFHLRADRMIRDKNNQVRRRVIVEYLEGDVESNLASAAQSLTAAGFNSRPRREPENGNIVLPFVKPGYGTITLVGQPIPGDNPSNPASKGTLTLDFPWPAEALAPIPQSGN